MTDYFGFTQEIRTAKWKHQKTGSFFKVKTVFFFAQSLSSTLCVSYTVYTKVIHIFLMVTKKCPFVCVNFLSWHGSSIDM